MTSGQFLREIRNEKKFSLRQLSIKSGVSHTQIADVEKGVNFGTKEKLDKILIALKATSGEVEKFYKLQNYEKTPNEVMIELENLRKQNDELKQKLQDCEKNLVIAHNNSGHIVVGDNNITGKVSSVDTKLQDEFEDLSERQKEKVIKFINEFIK